MKKIIPVLFLLAFGCKKSDTNGSLQMSDIPLRVGDSWSYVVTNYPVTETDTALFQVVSLTTINADSSVYKTITSIRGVVVDSGIICKTGSTYAYAGDNGRQTYAGSGLFDGWTLTFPISATPGAGNGNSVKVVSTNQIVTISGTPFINVTTLARTSITPGGVITDTMLLAPRIGIIQWDGAPIVGYHIP